MWGNIELLRSISHVLMWVSIASAVLAAVATGLRYYVDRRVSELSSQAEAARTEQKERESGEREAAVRSQLQNTEQKLQHSAGKLAQLEERARPRSLSEEQTKIMIAAIRSCSPKVVGLTAPLNDAEAISFAGQIEALFKAAGWESRSVAQAVFSGTPVGVILRVRAKDSVHPCTLSVQQAFAAIGISAPAEIVPTTPLDIVDVVIGHKL
jgi:hypothetical protein